MVHRWFSEFKRETFASAGDVAPLTIELNAGPLKMFQHTMEPHLRKLGLPTKLDSGKKTTCAHEWYPNGAQPPESGAHVFNPSPKWLFWKSSKQALPSQIARCLVLSYEHVDASEVLKEDSLKYSCVM